MVRIGGEKFCVAGTQYFTRRRKSCGLKQIGGTQNFTQIFFHVLCNYEVQNEAEIVLDTKLFHPPQPVDSLADSPERAPRKKALFRSFRVQDGAAAREAVAERSDGKSSKSDVFGDFWLLKKRFWGYQAVSGNWRSDLQWTTQKRTVKG